MIIGLSESGFSGLYDYRDKKGINPDNSIETFLLSTHYFPDVLHLEGVGHLFLQSESGFSGLYDYRDKKGIKLNSSRK